MRHLSIALTVCLCLCSACPTLAAQSAAVSNIPANAPGAAAVQEYLRLFGYRQMMETGAERQLASILELVRQTRADLAPGVLELIHDELRAELRAASEESVNEMVVVFQHHFTREDVAYLIEVGRDPRMQKVVALQPSIAADMEAIGERLADTVTAKAAPRIEERLKKLEGGQQL